MQFELAARVRGAITVRQMTAQVARHARTVDGILGASVDLIFLVDRSGKYTYVSRTAAQAGGMSAREMIGKTWQELGWSPKIMQRVHAECDSIFTTAEPVKGEVIVPTAAWGTRDYEYILGPVYGTDGSVEAVVATLRDITDRKDAEEAWQLAKEAARTRQPRQKCFFGKHEPRVAYSPERDYRLQRYAGGRCRRVGQLRCCLGFKQNSECWQTFTPTDRRHSRHFPKLKLTRWRFISKASMLAA